MLYVVVSHSIHDSIVFPCFYLGLSLGKDWFG